MTIEDVSRLLGLHWNTVKTIEKECLKRKYSHIDLSDLKYIAIDEFAVKKGHVYHTVVMDLATSRVIYVAEGRSSDCLDKFWQMLKRQQVQLKAIAMDMWPAYISSALCNSPGTPIVFDRFHIVKKLNDAIDQTRRSLYAMETDLHKKKLTKGLRWLLLKKNTNLKASAREKLQEALELNKPLAEAYYLKEELSLLWQSEDVKDAEIFLNNWTCKAEATGIVHMKKFAGMLKAHRTGLFNWFKHPISTSPLEGMNNKIKVLKRRAFGYRDMEFFNLKILDLHNSRYALLG